MLIVYVAVFLLAAIIWGDWKRWRDIRWKQGMWVSFWIFLYSILEYINLHYLYLIRHHNGWNMMWSVIFNIVMFLMFRIHHKKPLLAWGLSVIWILFLLMMFPIPLEKMK